MNAGEILQRTARCTNTAHVLTHIKLYDCVNFQCVVSERRVTQPETKRKKRLPIVIHILTATRTMRVVEDGKLSHTARKRNGQSASRVVVAEEGFSDRLAAKLSGIPRFEDRWNMVLGPTDR